ncbi:MAG TPA: AAA family ATPase [Candidatus Binataceae bacterium]|nr:AAA family ATPase [Candidatus Binataceae bacterium]
MAELIAPAGPETAPELRRAYPAAELKPAELRANVAIDNDDLSRAADTDRDAQLLGQSRAIDAIGLAIGIDAPGYNLFISGLRTRVERDSVLALLAAKAATMPTPGDWVYVNNFRNPESPTAIYLRAGQGRDLAQRMSDLVGFVAEQLPKAFRREDFDRERAVLRDKYNQRAQELIKQLETRARERGLALQAGPGGQVIFIPLVDGKLPDSPDALQKAMNEKPEAEREDLTRAQAELQDEFGSLMSRQQDLMRDLVDDIHAIERAFAARLITPAAEELKRHFNNPGVTGYVDQAADHMLSHLDRFREIGPGPQQPGGEPAAPAPEDGPRWFEYQVNVMVDNSTTQGAPVVSEDAPTYRNLFGTIERWIDPLGRSGTNFTRIIGGSFLKSHGGFLVLDLEDAVVEPGVWKTLKRSLKSGRMTIETFEPLPFFSMSGLKPEPIEVHTKLIVLGGPYLYNMLYFYDSEFSDLFKVKAEMRPSIEIDDSAARHYAGHVGSLARREGLPPFSGDALRRIVEYGMRQAGDRTRVLAMLEPIDDLARESAYFTRQAHAAQVSGAHVERALAERVLRLNYIEEEIRRMIARGTLVVQVTGNAVGQINGLAVIDVGGYAFGRPSRVTATVALGQAGLINIERESRLSGSTHDKGIMILGGFLRERFGQEHPIAMTASICFEQSYSGIDGDSASSTELYALLSALSGVPIRQDLAVTGSVDQRGNVQAIGGVNEKIEGYFRVCKAIGLSGTQGVMVPRSNLDNLMLEPETIAAVERGQFHIYPIDTIDHGIELLTGVRAGSADAAGTINFLVDQRLRRMAELLRSAGAGETRVIHETDSAPAARTPPAPPGPPR